jgi:hypothetical protein
MWTRANGQAYWRGTIAKRERCPFFRYDYTRLEQVLSLAAPRWVLMVKASTFLLIAYFWRFNSRISA